MIRGPLPLTAHPGIAGAVGLDLTRSEARSAAIRAALSNTFTLGGSNVCLALRRLSS